MTKEELIKYFKFEDMTHQNPNSEPFVILGGYETWTPLKLKNIGLDSELIDYRSFMINVEDKEAAFNSLDYSDMHSFQTGYFDEDSSGRRKYITGESWEHHTGLTVEPLYINRQWSGLKLFSYEPSQRMVLYLNLMNNGNEWTDPYKHECVIRYVNREEEIEGTKHKVKRIEIKIDYLKDYLAARGAGLFITRFARRSVLFESPDQIPMKSEYMDIPNGTWNFLSTNDNPALRMIAPGKTLGDSEIRQKFWIEPFPQPRRWDACKRSEFEGGVVYTLHDGTKGEYNVEKGHEEDYFKLISFNPRIMEIFLCRPHFDYEEYSRETIGLSFPNGETLHVGINPSGQIQVWWGQIAKLSKEYQELLAPNSESWKERLYATHDYIRVTIHGNFPETKPLRKTLQDLKTEINKYFLSKAGDTFFNQDSSDRDLKRVYEPYEVEPYQVLDIMEQIDKWLFSEKRPDRIIEYFNLAEEIDDKNSLPKIKSLVSLTLLLKKYFGEQEAESRTKVLKTIKELRQCKAHFKDLSKVLRKYNLEDKSPIEIYRMQMLALEELLQWLNQFCNNDRFL
jgi:hypothetical protein